MMAGIAMKLIGDKDYISQAFISRSAATWNNSDHKSAQKYDAKNSCLQYRRSQSEKNRYFKTSDFMDTPYYRALVQPFKSNVQKTNLADSQAPRHFLTIDLCPSTAEFEYAFFEALIGRAHVEKRAIPITICISGLWIVKYEDALAWLKQQQEDGHLQITWINHSLSHPYYSDLADQDNFLNHRMDLFEDEVLQTEIMMLQRGLLFAPCFRFPGLILSPHTLQKLKDYGLVELGTNAWLAKGDEIQDGSVILVHGNGNEQPGVLNRLIQHLPSLNLRPLTYVPYRRRFKPMTPTRDVGNVFMINQHFRTIV